MGCLNTTEENPGADSNPQTKA
jgi:calcium-dependent protein kinase